MFSPMSDATNPFLDQSKFMQACGQTVNQWNESQYLLYRELIREEVADLAQAETHKDALDALIDILVVTIGAIHSAGYNGEAAWHEVMRTNFAKVDPETGRVRKREDGKVLKPEGWTPPDLEPFTRMPNL